MPRYKLTVAYDGTGFCGWQKQEPLAPVNDPALGAVGGAEGVAESKVDRVLGVREGESRPRVALRTVQGVLERAVREIVREPVVLMGASRTDAGVHARGQVAAFTCGPTAVEGAREGATSGGVGTRVGGWPVERGIERLRRAINGRLPEDVLVVAAEEVPGTFDPIGDCTSKAYSYTFHEGLDPPLWDRHFVHSVWTRLDEARMDEAARLLEGEHDFASFAAVNHGRLTTVRRIFSCRVERTGPERVRLEVSGSGFLYNMVRIIAGTLGEIGRGRHEPGAIAGMLAARDRRASGPTYPASGLCLEWVRYGGRGGEGAGLVD